MSGDARTIHPFSEDQGPAMDEPIRETVKRDMLLVGSKFAYVCNPSEWEKDSNRLKEWDLWGPLLMCVLLSLGCWLKCGEALEKRTVFSFVFGFYWSGLMAIVFNIGVIGGSLPSYIQGLAVLGYTSFPMVVCSVMALLIPDILAALRFVAVVGGSYMSVKASTQYLASVLPEHKFYLGFVPLLLFYSIIGWIICVI